MADILRKNQTLNVGEQLVSQNGRFNIIMQSDGNFVLYDKQQNIATWASNTYLSDVNHVIMQHDGNLVAYNNGTVSRWASNTWNSDAAYAIIQNDGNFVLYNNENNPRWASNTMTNIQTLPEGSHAWESGSIGFDGLALGGWIKLIASSNGDYSFQGHMHDSGFNGYWYSATIVLVTPLGIAFTFQRKGSVEGTVNALPFGTPKRNDDWIDSGNNPSIAQHWDDIMQGKFSWKAEGTDSLVGGLQNALEDAVNQLAEEGVRIAITAVIAVVAA